MNAADAAATSRREQGLPERVADPVALARLAALLEEQNGGGHA